MSYDGGPDVLHAVNLRLGAGEFCFLTGPAGAGKTSLLRLASLSHPPSAGTVSLFGRDVHGLAEKGRARLRRRIGVVFQDFRLLDHLSAFDNVALPLRIVGAREDQISGFVSEMLTWLGLSDMGDTRPSSLSTGQQQLLAVARAIITRPALLLADEPTSSVDTDASRRLMHLLVQLRKIGTAVLLATHSRDLPRRYGFPTLHMQGGRLDTGDGALSDQATS